MHELLYGYLPVQHVFNFLHSLSERPLSGENGRIKLRKLCRRGILGFRFLRLRQLFERLLFICCRIFVHKLRYWHVSSCDKSDSLSCLPRRKLLRYHGTLCRNSIMCCRVLLGHVSKRVLELRGGHLSGQQWAELVRFMWGRIVLCLFRPLCFHELPSRELLRRWLDCYGKLQRWVLFRDLG